MAETKLRHISQVPVQVGLPASISSPIKRDLFAGKHEAQLGKVAGIAQFGVNHVMLEPGSISSLRHWHEGEDEFVFVLSGELTLIDDNGEHTLTAGSFAGFRAGSANAHHLANKSQAPAVFIAIGTRKVGQETIHYPDDAIGCVTIHRDAGGERR
ncbi:MAG: cupin domain-containing protein [Alphaproteobacteria bacterium]|nr:cupin domain-containing protein [Alphaproteobacteria bacterium]